MRSQLRHLQSPLRRVFWELRLHLRRLGGTADPAALNGSPRGADTAASPDPRRQRDPTGRAEDLWARVRPCHTHTALQSLQSSCERPELAHKVPFCLIGIFLSTTKKCPQPLAPICWTGLGYTWGHPLDLTCHPPQEARWAHCPSRSPEVATRRQQTVRATVQVWVRQDRLVVAATQHLAGPSLLSRWSPACTSTQAEVCAWAAGHRTRWMKSHISRAAYVPANRLHGRLFS
uniref:Uncharacterized protein n=1 Tax=Molossus molossus TaxID=27622 RepID=A0A7J8E2V9_MOLMO|nr:hypothetical protein HJG59_008961 [Molossus molossus]